MGNLIDANLKETPFPAIPPSAAVPLLTVLHTGYGNLIVTTDQIYDTALRFDSLANSVIYRPGSQMNNQ